MKSDPIVMQLAMASCLGRNGRVKLISHSL